MQKMMKRVAISILMATGIAGASGFTAAQAAPETFADASMTPSAGGSAVVPDNTDVTIDDAAADGGVTTYDSVSAGGGTWSYGTGSHNGTINKGCYSNYKHNSKYHSSSAIIGNDTSTDYAAAYAWSKAYAWSGPLHTCNAYWNTY